jgi:DNA invertase Pin-like site-specific DNA recombinase
VRLTYVTYTPADSPEGRLRGYVKRAVVEYERETIRQRTGRGRTFTTRDGPLRAEADRRQQPKQPGKRARQP